MTKKILYIDMDGVLVDFQGAARLLSEETLNAYKGNPEDVPGIFARMLPMPGAVESFTMLAAVFDVYILSTAPWENPSAWSDKLLWVKRFLGAPAVKRLILSHHKNLNRGDFLIDDRTKHGTDEFAGEHIHFGTPAFPDWPTVVNYLLTKA